MLICRVTGQAVSTVKHGSLQGYKLLVCEPLAGLGAPATAPTCLAVDLTGAGEGDVVAVVTGDPARHAAGVQVPVDAAIVAILDSVTAQGKTIEGRSR
ncbi:MAG: ethanolamine utilization protein EutN [Bacillota bacterium]|nr:MAG: ethanolamine utilization protein EutN [Bacillota bacterium]